MGAKCTQFTDLVVCYREISNSSLSTVPAGLLDNLTALQLLSLNTNQLTRLRGDEFNRLPALSQL